MMGLFDKKYVRRILKTLFYVDNMRYSELKRRLTGISPKTLVERLRDLENFGVIERSVHAEVPIRVEYRLTPRGIELARLVVATCEWVEKWYPTTPS
jgi:DNA-binding HxlR family transcriptional regulator